MLWLWHALSAGVDASWDWALFDALTDEPPSPMIRSRIPTKTRGSNRRYEPGLDIYQSTWKTHCNRTSAQGSEVRLRRIGGERLLRITSGDSSDGSAAAQSQIAKARVGKTKRSGHSKSETPFQTRLEPRRLSSPTPNPKAGSPAPTCRWVCNTFFWFPGFVPPKLVDRYMWFPVAFLHCWMQALLT